MLSQPGFPHVPSRDVSSDCADHFSSFFFCQGNLQKDDSVRGQQVCSSHTEVTELQCASRMNIKHLCIEMIKKGCRRSKRTCMLLSRELAYLKPMPHTPSSSLLVCPAQGPLQIRAELPGMAM